MEKSFPHTTAVGQTHPSRTPTGGMHRNNAVASDLPSESPPPPAPVPALGRPRAPGSVSAVKDGKNLLSAFRRNKRRSRDAIGGGTTSTPPAIPVPHSYVNRSNPSSEGTLPADKSIVDDLGRFQSDAPNLARNLEAALDASLPQHRRAQAQHDNVAGGGGSVDGDGLTGERNGGEPKCEKDLQLATESRSNGGAVAVACGASDNAAELSAGDEAGDCCGAGDGDDAVATAAAATADADAAADAATAASKASPPKEDNKTAREGSPPRPTPEIVRQAARTSQAAFLSSVLPTQDLDFDTANSDSSNPFTPTTLPGTSLPNGRHRSPVVGPGEPGRAAGLGKGGVSGLGAAISSGSGVGPTSSDTQAAARWASMRRLEDQGAGLGNAADHQLARALQLCRDLRGQKAGVGGASLSVHGQASRLDALQSTLHGLEEVLSKRRVVDKTARAEAEALGGPAAAWSLLNDDEGSVGDKDETQVAASGRGEGAATGTTTAIGGGGSGGWLTGSQLKDFEKKVEARSSIEISALESERRKLRSKVEMFQRQVQLLQREGAGHSPAPANGSSGKIGGYPAAAAAAATGEGDSGVGGGFGTAAGEKRFADLLDARLGEERIVQATLEAELASLRRTIEEKDGLVSALREALRSAATPASGGDASTARAGTLAEHGAAQPPARRRSADGMLTPRSADGRAVVPGRGVFSPHSSDSSRSRGRYHSRSSRFLSAQGPVAAAAAAAEAVASRHERGGPWSGNSSSHGSTYVAAGENRFEEIRRPPPIGDSNDDVDSAVPAVGGAGGASDEATARNGNTSAATEAGSDDTSNGGGHAAAAATMVRNRAGGDFSGRGTAPKSAEGNDGIISQATAMTSSALRMLWNSAWGVRSRVGLDGSGDGLESPRKAQRKGGSSSHAVLIL